VSTSQSLTSAKGAPRGATSVGNPARLISTLILTLSLAALPHIRGWVAPFVALSLVTAMLILRPNLAQVARRFALCVPMIAALAVPFLLGGQFEAAARFTFRALSAALVVLTFTAGMSPADLARALASLRVPQSLVEVVDGLLLEFDSLAPVARRIVLAQRLRGARGLSIFVRLVPELLVQSAERAARVDLARRLRGYSTSRDARTLAPADLLSVFGAVSCALLMHVLALR
jgi:energy-coupling factor transporter transmembrane protein EcfT